MNNYKPDGYTAADQESDRSFLVGTNFGRSAGRREMGATIAERLDAEVRPLIEVGKYAGGYDCCGCDTYDQILDHAIRIVREEVEGS